MDAALAQSHSDSDVAKAGPRRLTLAADEQIVAVVPERAAGPGWSNTPVWVHIVGQSGQRYRCECFQPQGQSPELMALFRIGEEVCKSLKDAVPVDWQKR
jgi:hypothetical protein